MENLFWITDITVAEMCELLGVDPDEVLGEEEGE